MTARIKGFAVSPEKDIREDDANEIAAALRMIKGVVSVEALLLTEEDWYMREQARMEFRQRIWDALQERGKG